MPRKHLEDTINNIKGKYYTPKGAARTLKLELVKSKRSAENHITRQRSHPYNTIDVVESRETPTSHELYNSIVACTIEESIHYG